MGKTYEFIYLVVWYVFWVCICSGLIWGGLAEKAYDWRMKYKVFLMPGRLADREDFIESQRNFGVAGLIFGTAFFILILLHILGLIH